MSKLRLNSLASKILVALAAVAIPATAITAFLGWTLISTVGGVENDVETSLSTAHQLAEIRVLMQKEHGIVGRLPSELDLAKIDELAAEIGKINERIDNAVSALAINQRIVTPELAAQVRESRGSMMSAAKEVISAAKSFAQATAVKIVNGPFESHFSVVVALLDAVSSNVSAMGESARGNLKSSSARAWGLAPIGVLVILLAAGGCLLFVRRGVIAPLGSIATAMVELSDGKFELRLPDSARQDEIGRMSRAVAVFRDAALEKNRLAVEAEEQRNKSEAERARNAEMQARVAEEQARVVATLAEGLKKLSDGDLTCRLHEGFTDSYLQIKNDFNATMDRLQETMGMIIASTREVTNAATEISSSTTDLSQRTEEQAASLEETSASMEQLAATVKKNAENAQHANQYANETRTVADRSGEVISAAVASMARIEESSKKISDIIGVIDEIAFQTNLLALNAAVEAARAGEAGRGFAVVAAEVRGLAQRSSQAAKDIKDLINNSSDQVQEGVELVNRAGTALTEIMGSIKRVADIVSEIASASSEQATGIDQINTALAQMDEVTQQNSALVEENAASVKTLEQQSQSMSTRVAVFRLEGSMGARPTTEPVQALRSPSPDRPAASGRQRNTQRGNGRGPVGRKQAALAAAVNENPDWKEF